MVINLPFVWLGIFVFMLIFEMLTMGLTTVFFAGGAIVALILCVIGLPLWIQCLAFVVVSGGMLAFVRPYAEKYFNKNRTTTNVEALSGKNAIVTEAIDNVKGLGQVKLNGMEWTARGEGQDAKIPAGTEVVILEVKGVRLIVKPVE